MSFVVGAHPIDHVAAMMRMPVDELGIVGIAARRAAAVVKCVTNDIRVPADAEMVIEGYFDARGHVEVGRPLWRVPRLLRRREDAIRCSTCTAITRRRDALFQTATIGGRAHEPHRHRAAQRACAPK